MTKFKTTTVKWKDEEDAKLFAATKVEDEVQAESDSDFDVDDQKAHNNLINDITKISKRKRMAPAPRNVRASAEEGGTRVNSIDILKRIGQKDLANAVGKISTLPKPQEKVVLRRLKRAAGYEKVAEESEKWKNLVERRRTSDQLKFPLQAPDVRVHTALKTEETKMKTPLEQEVYSLLLGAKMMEDKKETQEELMRKRAMSLEELKERNRLAWKLKAEKRKMEYKAWQQNKNKSRKFHRLLRRERLKKQKAELEQLEKINPEVALEKLEELERLRVEERMTLRHKQSKWAHLQGFRATRDPKAMEALKENKDVHQELLAKRKRQESSSEGEEEENIEEKLEALKKERQAAIEAGLFDPANPWMANLFDQVPERLEVTPDSAIDDSFVNFKKFWDEVNRRRLKEKMALKIAEAKKTESGENSLSDNDDDDEEMEATDDDDDDGDEVDNTEKKKVDNKEVARSNNKENEGMETEEKMGKNLKKRKLKNDKKGKTKKIKTTDDETRQEQNEEYKIDEKEDEENNADDNEMEEKEEDKDCDKKKTKKGKAKKKKVIGCKSIKKSNVKAKGKDKKKKKTEKASNKAKSEEKEGSMKTVDNEDQQKENVTKMAKENSGGKKKKLNKKQEDAENEETQSKDGKKLNKKEKKKKKKGSNAQNNKQEIKSSSNQVNNEEENDDSETNKEIRDKEEEEENKDINNSEDIDLEEQLISIDNMFNQAELGLQKKLKKKLERMGITRNASQEWTKVQTKKDKKKKTKRTIDGGEEEKSEKSILPKIEEYDFKTKKDQDNLDEKVERAKTLEDMDELQNATENEDQLQKALKTLQAVANRENGAGKDSAADKKQTAPTKIAQVDPSKFIEVDAKKLLTAMPDTIGRGDEALDDEEEDDDEAEDIIREAFADDYLVNEFKSEKDLAREQDKPKALCLAMPGWGNWTGPNLKMSNRLRKRFTIRAPKAPPRKDDTLGNVIYDEKADVHENLRKVMVNELPFPFSSVKEFEASVRAPVGRLFVPEKQHQNLTAPPLVTKIGTVIEPMTEEELLKHEKRIKGPQIAEKQKKEKRQTSNKQTGQVGKKQGRQIGKKPVGNSGKKHTGRVNKKKSS